MRHGQFFERLGRVLLASGVALALLVPGPVRAMAVTSIDLNDFFFFPGDPVSVALDGSSATLDESPFFAFVALDNNPFLGDPVVIVPGADTFVVFDYVFTESPGDDEAFGAAVIDDATGLPITGFEFLTGTPGSGAVEFALSTLAGSTLGFQFTLGANFGDAAFGSSVTVSNLRLETRTMASALAEPSALGLALLALPLVASRRRAR